MEMAAAEFAGDACPPNPFEGDEECLNERAAAQTPCNFSADEGA